MAAMGLHLIGMKWKEIANRLNGLTLGPIGLQWTAKPSDREVAARVIHFLEDRRILYNDCAWEEPSHCVSSVLEIRHFLTSEIMTLKDQSDILGPLRVMRAACRKFLDQMQIGQGRGVPLHRHMGSYEFYGALGEFRGAIGPQVALLAGHFKIDVENELAKTLPLEDREQ